MDSWSTPNRIYQRNLRLMEAWSTFQSTKSLDQSFTMFVQPAWQNQASLHTLRANSSMVTIRSHGHHSTSVLKSGQTLGWLPGIFDQEYTANIASRTCTQRPQNPSPLEINPNVSRLQTCRERPLLNQHS